MPSFPHPIRILDEPTTGLDPEGRADLWAVLTGLASGSGTTILVTTHYLEEAGQFAARIAITDRGKIVAEGTSDQLKAGLHGDSVLLELEDAERARQAEKALARVPEVREVTADGARLQARWPRGRGRCPPCSPGWKRAACRSCPSPSPGPHWTTSTCTMPVARSARQAWVIFTSRYLRQLYRQPVVIFRTLTQPVIWLLLFGALFKRVTELPGFGGGNYASYLTPGVVIMTAMFASSWTGMSYIEDMQAGVMDRFLTAPVSRAALTMAMLAYQAVTTVIQSAIVMAMGWGIGAVFPGGAGGIAALIGVSVLIALAMAGLSSGFALLVRQREALIGASTTLVMPLTFLSGAFLSLRLVPGWIAGIARFNPVNWAASAGRIAVGSTPAWSAVVAAVASTRAFRPYQRSM